MLHILAIKRVTARMESGGEDEAQQEFHGGGLPTGIEGLPVVIGRTAVPTGSIAIRACCANSEAAPDFASLIRATS